MNLATVVTTRFELRRDPREQNGLFGVAGADLFNPVRLRQRLDYLKWVAGPSIRAQSHADFVWAILYDVDFPEPLLTELRAFAATIPQARLVSNASFFAPEVPESEQGMGRMGWLRPLLPAETSHVLSVNLDGDDALGRHALRRLNAQVHKDAPKSLRFYGWTGSTHWWVEHTPEAPLGHWWEWAPQGRDPRTLRSAGFSVVAPAECPAHTLAFPHHIPHLLRGLEQHRQTSVLGKLWPKLWWRFQTSSLRRRFTASEREWMRRVEQAVMDVNRWLQSDAQVVGLPGEWVAEGFDDSGEILMLEHDSNIEMARRDFSARGRERVSGDGFLGEVVVDWEAMEAWLGQA